MAGGLLWLQSREESSLCPDSGRSGSPWEEPVVFAGGLSLGALLFVEGWKQSMVLCGGKEPVGCFGAVLCWGRCDGAGGEPWGRAVLSACSVEGLEK